MAMWQQSNNLNIIRKTFFLIIVIALAIRSNSQVNELNSSSVLDYLYRMAQKGSITWKDYQLPVDRKAIAMAIDSLSLIQNQLTKTEAKELEFYKQEYAFDESDLSRTEKNFFKRDDFKRFRVAKYEKGEAKIFVDPLIGYRF